MFTQQRLMQRVIGNLQNGLQLFYEHEAQAQWFYEIINLERCSVKVIGEQQNCNSKSCVPSTPLASRGQTDIASYFFLVLLSNNWYVKEKLMLGNGGKNVSKSCSLKLFLIVYHSVWTSAWTPASREHLFEGRKCWLHACEIISQLTVISQRFGVFSFVHRMPLIILKELTIQWWTNKASSICKRTALKHSLSNHDRFQDVLPEFSFNCSLLLVYMPLSEGWGSFNSSATGSQI